MTLRRISGILQVVCVCGVCCCAISVFLSGLALADLRSPTNSYDYVLLAPDDLLQAAMPLVQHRQDSSPCGGGGGLRALGVTTSQVYSEFSPGAKGIKEFLSYAYHNWAGRPRFVFLVGDANWDSTQSGNLIPSHYVFFDFGSGPSRIAWDDWFVCVDENDSLPKMAIGRLPARTASEVTAYISKVLEYEGAYGSHRWKDNLLFVAEDENLSGRSGTYVREAVQDLLANHTPSFFWDRLAFYATQPEYDTREESKTALVQEINRITDGKTLIVGLGTMAGRNLFVGFLTLCQGADWCFGDADLSNTEDFPLVIGASCGLASFFYPQAPGYGGRDITLADVFLFAQDKGAIGWIGPACDASYQASNHMLTREVLDHLFLNESLPVGEAFRGAKIDAELAYPYLLWPIREYVFLGDPALIWARNYSPEITTIQGLPFQMQTRASCNVSVDWTDRNGTLDCYPGSRDFFWLSWGARLGSISNKHDNFVTYTAPTLSQSAWDTLTVSVLDQTNRSSTEMRRVFITVPSGGCPFLLARDKIGYVLDNSILRKSEGTGIGMSEDSYLIQAELAPVDGQYWLQIAEFENEVSKIDETKLIVVDHPQMLPPGVYVIGKYETLELHAGIDQRGAPFLYTLNAPPMIVDASSSTASSMALQWKDGTTCEGETGDWIRVRFEGYVTESLGTVTGRDEESQAPFDGLFLVAAGKPPIPCEDDCDPSPPVTDVTQSESAGGLVVEIAQEDRNGWTGILALTPRENMSSFLVELDESAIPLIEKYGLRIRWLGKHKLDQVALYKRRDVPFTYRVLEPTQALHARSGAQIHALAEVKDRDNRYVELRPDQTLSLGFPFEEPFPGQVRELFFSCYGGYNSLGAAATAPTLAPAVTTSCAPNPFAAGTKLEVSLKGHPAKLTVDIFDCAGRFVKRIFDADAEQGNQTLWWNGKDEAGNLVKSGVYLCRTNFGTEEVTTKLVFIR